MNDGEKISGIRKAWASATQKAGLPGVLLHDLRRSAIMNFSQKGIDQQTGMLLRSQNIIGLSQIQHTYRRCGSCRSG